MIKKIKSTHNSTPHILSICDCGWQSGGCNNTPKVRNELFSHMKKNNCKGSSLEVGRISHYELVYD